MYRIFSLVFNGRCACETGSTGRVDSSQLEKLNTLGVTAFSQRRSMYLRISRFLRDAQIADPAAELLIDLLHVVEPWREGGGKSVVNMRWQQYHFARLPVLIQKIVNTLGVMTFSQRRSTSTN